MNNRKSKNFKKDREKVAEILTKYQIYKIKLHSNKQNLYKQEHSTIERYEKFIKFIDLVFKHMNQQNVEFLINVFIKNKTSYEMNFSRTSFYR